MPRTLGWLVCLLLAAGSTACAKWEDCKLYHTCTDDLAEVAQAELDSLGRQPVCKQCLDKSCSDSMQKCSVDEECNMAARCRLTTTPFDYQHCIAKLYALGYTNGRESAKPWEGHYWDTPDNAGSTFVHCLRTSCAGACTQKRFLCAATPGNYKKPFTIRLEVRMYDSQAPSEFRPVRRVLARLCAGPSTDIGCGPFTGPKEDGSLVLSLDDVEAPDRVPAEWIHFQLKYPEDAGVPEYPPTLFYPRRLDGTGEQLVTAYVVRSEDIAKSNEALKQGREVLQSAGQSLILPDGCLWEEYSVPNVKVFVRKVEGSPDDVPQCRWLWDEKDSELRVCERCGKPCVWYTNGNDPTLWSTETNGRGAGVAGLSPGKYEVIVQDADGVPVSRRTVDMLAGWMTVVRTWSTGTDRLPQ